MPAAERKAFLLRVPGDLWKDLEKWAADDLRSINAQIEFLLRQSVNARKGRGGPKEK
ncbi:MAG: toxin-antitoxin system HicB family antitoxin [Steroidobacteraceae bacterium]